MFFNRTGLIGTSNNVFVLNYFGNEVKVVSLIVFVSCETF